MAEIGGGMRLPGVSAYYSELAEIRGERLLGASANCQEMAGMEGEKGLP